DWIYWLVHVYLDRGDVCYIGERFCVGGGVSIIISLIVILLIFLSVFFLMKFSQRKDQ
ncbi:hypothetical protein LCGC14_2130570, partial [marine sediment metagenome]